MKRILPLLAMLLSSFALANPMQNITHLLQPVAPISLAAQAQVGQAWTILVYLHADHNLWRSALTDLLEMQRVGSSNNVRFVVQIDAQSPKSRYAEKQYPSFDGAVRGLVTKADATDRNAAIAQLSDVERIAEPNSDDPQVLSDFIAWGVRRYPAQRYGLILWDHGGQWDGGFGFDETTVITTRKSSFMQSWQVRQGMQAGMAQVGLQKFDFLALDTCLMGGLELLFEYADLTKYYIADPEIDYGAGWDYTASFGLLRDNPSISARDFAIQEVNHWDAHHQRSASDRSDRAHTAYDVQQLTSLRNAVNTFVQTASQSADRAALLSARSKVVEYQFDSESPNDPLPYIDIGHYGQLVAQLTRDNALAQAGNTLANAVRQVVLAKSLGSSKLAALGLSVWLPNSPNDKPDTATLANYNTQLQLAKTVQWNQFINLWYGNVTTTVQPVDVRVTQTINLLEPTDREPAVIGFSVSGNANLIYGELGEVGERNSFKVYGQLYLQPGGANQYEYNWDGRWYEIQGANNSSDFFNGFFQRPNDSTMYANASYTPVGQSQGYAVIVIADLTTSKIISVLDNSSIAPREITLQPGGVLRFQLLQKDQLTDETTLVPTGRVVTIPSNGIAGMQLQRNRMPLGEYILIFGARDQAGNIRTGFAPVQIR